MQCTQSSEKILLHLSLSRITFLTFQEKVFLEKKLDSPHSLALLSIEDISSFLNRKFKNGVIWDGKENLHMAEVALTYCERSHIQILLHSDIRYPELLRQITDPPYLLFCRGNVEALTGKSISVVGSRKLSQKGREAALEFTNSASKAGVSIISGLAFGADGYAHQGVINAYFDAIENNEEVSVLGKTIAVIPGAIDDIIPYGHKRLAAQIIQAGGCLVSEYEPGMEFATWHFVARNRIIAGLSPATVVIEAPAGSGSLITADFALGYGREVLFHEAAFGPMASRISEVVKRELEVEHAVGRVKKYKIENTPVKYLEAGAPVIKNYKDYCVAMSEAPGKRSINPIQGELF